VVTLEKPAFDAAAFLASAGLGRRIVQLAPKQTFFTQGDPADAVFYLQKGRVRVTVVSTVGKEATITLLAGWGFYWRRVAGGGGRAAPGHGHGSYRLHRAQDSAGGDDPRDARGA
jgi:CRP-like cAMP-binding protein